MLLSRAPADSVRVEHAGAALGPRYVEAALTPPRRPPPGGLCSLRRVRGELGEEARRAPLQGWRRTRDPLRSTPESASLPPPPPSAVSLRVLCEDRVLSATAVGRLATGWSAAWPISPHISPYLPISQVGDRVECSMAGGMRQAGEVVQLLWRDEEMEQGQVCPYKVKLDEGGVTWVPQCARCDQRDVSRSPSLLPLLCRRPSTRTTASAGRRRAAARRSKRQRRRRLARHWPWPSPRPAPAKRRAVSCAGTDRCPRAPEQCVQGDR